MILTFRVTQCHDLDLSGSRDVISNVTIRISMGHFLLVVHWNQVCISSRFRDRVLQGHKHIVVTTLTFQGHVTSSVT